MKLTTKSTVATAKKFQIEESDHGWYVWIWTETVDGPPDRDYLQDDLDMAKRFCMNRYGVPYDSWYIVSE